MTDEHGRASLPWAKGYRYEVSARGHSTWELPGPVTEGVPLEATLVRHARIYGRLAHTVDKPNAKETQPRIILFQGTGPSAAARSEFVAALGVEAGPVGGAASWLPENSFSPHLGLIQPQARLDASGHWEVTCIPFSRDQLTQTGVIVRCDLGSHARTIAGGIVLRAGDDLLVHDMFGGRPALNMQCVDEQGRPLDISGEISLHMDTEHLPKYGLRFGGINAQIAPGGRLHLPCLPRGQWELYKVMERDEIKVLASFDHSSAAGVNLLIAEGAIPWHWRPERIPPVLDRKSAAANH